MHLLKKEGQVNLKTSWKKNLEATTKNVQAKRAQKPNPKYANVALVVGLNINEPRTYKEAYQK